MIESQLSITKGNGKTGQKADPVLRVLLKVALEAAYSSRRYWAVAPAFG